MANKKRTKANCIFHKEVGNEFCKATNCEKCEPETCPFWRDAAGMEESQEKARQNFIKRWGFDGYGKVKYAAEGQYVSNVIEYRQNHVKEANRSGRSEGKN